MWYAKAPSRKVPPRFWKYWKREIFTWEGLSLSHPAGYISRGVLFWSRCPPGKSPSPSSHLGIVKEAHKIIILSRITSHPGPGRKSTSNVLDSLYRFQKDWILENHQRNSFGFHETYPICEKLLPSKTLAGPLRWTSSNKSLQIVLKFYKTLDQLINTISLNGT